MRYMLYELRSKIRGFSMMTWSHVGGACEFKLALPSLFENQSSVFIER
jgi:hypothetical protein